MHLKLFKENNWNFTIFSLSCNVSCPIEKKSGLAVICLLFVCYLFVICLLLKVEKEIWNPSFY